MSDLRAASLAGALALALALTLLATGLGGCRAEPDPGAPPPPTPPTAQAGERWLVDATVEAGLDFVHENGAVGELFFVENLGAAAALFDCDGDGDLDLLLRQGGPLVGAVPPGAPTDRLYRNDLGPGGARFVDVTAASGLDRPAYGMGVATGDYDGDGHVDLYLTNFGSDRLLRGLGGCRFEDRSAALPGLDGSWSVPALFFDADGDGWLDLWVGHYVRYAVAENRPCFRADSSPDYCGPTTYPAVVDRFWRNRGDGTFEERTGPAGLAAGEAGRALGAVALDVDRDGRPDLFVANDATDNHLWMNRGGSFAGEGLARGVAVNAAGLRTGDMGVEAADFDGDGDFDLAVTHLPEEGLGYWDNDGAGWFWERGAAAGLVRWTAGDTGFGTGALDLENDGWLDLYLANGTVRAVERVSRPGETLPLDQPNRLLRNLGGATFEDVSAAAGPALALSEVSRGVAVGDVDDDGDLDLVVTNNGGRARLLLSDAVRRGPWLGLRLVAADGRRDALGAEATLVCPSGRRLARRAATDGSYVAARDPRLHFGLGGCGDLETGGELEVRWPWGGRERFPVPPAGRYTTLRQGDGAPVS